jgi:hypothetical protein
LSLPIPRSVQAWDLAWLLHTGIPSTHMITSHSCTSPRIAWYTQGWRQMPTSYSSGQLSVQGSLGISMPSSHSPHASPCDAARTSASSWQGQVQGQGQGQGPMPAPPGTGVPPPLPLAAAGHSHTPPGGHAGPALLLPAAGQLPALPSPMPPPFPFPFPAPPLPPPGLLRQMSTGSGPVPIAGGSPPPSGPLLSPGRSAQLQALGAGGVPWVPLQLPPPLSAPAPAPVSSSPTTSGPASASGSASGSGDR